jgi:hypothetical protein
MHFDRSDRILHFVRQRRRHAPQDRQFLGTFAPFSLGVKGAASAYKHARQFTDLVSPPGFRKRCGSGILDCGQLRGKPLERPHHAAAHEPTHAER